VRIPPLTENSLPLRPEPGKTRITIRLDNKVLDYPRKRVHEMGGGNYQTLINDALREHIRRGGIEAAVRRAIREELREAGLKQAVGAGE
jgi:BrnA antitoxin of type II toxin-antitoxin system